MINEQGNVVFTKKELVELEFDPKEIGSLASIGFTSMGKRGRPSAYFGVAEVKGLLAARRDKRRKAAEQAVAQLLG